MLNLDSQRIRSERHHDVAIVIEEGVGKIMERWTRRAVEEQPTSQRVHHQVILDRLHALLRALARSLAESSDVVTSAHRSHALEHGEQRWETGWSLPEVIRDFQLLRIVLLDYLNEAMERPLTCREIIAVGLALDDAIASSVGIYVSSRDEYIRQIERERAEVEQRTEEARLRQHAEDLAEENRRKDEFLATLGHELRNPLGPIRNAIHVLQQRSPDAATLRWAQEVVERQVRHMTRLVDDLLDISRIARGKVQLEQQSLDLRSIVRITVDDLQAVANEAGLTLTVALPKEPVAFVGDGVRLTQVVSNLVLNALKFTESGGQVRVGLAVDRAAQQAAITVQDTGIGIDRALLPNIFQSYQQDEKNRERSRGGLGLGLALVKGLVELHGGQVEAQSAGPEQGSLFTVRLPLASAARTPAPEAAPVAAPTRQLRILVVDDHRDSAESLSVLLELQGHSVAVAYEGTEALESARRMRPDVVLCDIGLPNGMNGYEIARRLRSDPELSSVFLVALTGFGREEDIAQAKEAGFDQHLVKPFDQAVLQQLLAAVPRR